MSQLPTSPKLSNLKKSQTLSSPNILKEKLHLPSRYAHQKINNKNGFHDVLNSIESNLKSTQLQKVMQPQHKGLLLSSSKQKLKNKDLIKLDPINKQSKTIDFRAKPLKRQQSDLQNFKQIFIQPRQQVLKKIQSKSKQQFQTQNRQINQQYEKLLMFENGSSSPSASPKKSRSPVLQQIAKSPQKVQDLKDSQVHDYFKECMNLLDSQLKDNSRTADDFYEQQIRIQPPQLPNSTIASTLTPGSGYAPSIPLNAGNITKQQGNIKQLLMRAKAGMNTQDIQKQAHLSYFLGAVYEQKRKYSSALKFYRRFLGFAKAMQDKIGMTLGANRVAVNYYYHGDTNKSIAFHNQNLKLSDNQNCFAGFYNLGICYRKLEKYQQSLEHFETALQWATQKGQLQSQCITFGQLAVTYQGMELYQQSLDNFEKSLDLCHKLKKTKLQLFNLRNIIWITSEFNLRSSRNLLDIAQQAYQCSKSLENKQMVEIFGCNIGILKGFQSFLERRQHQIQNYQPDVQQIEDSQQQKENEKDDKYV